METKTELGDLDVNNLIYKTPDALSLSVHRTFKKQKFENDNFKSGGSANCVWNTGADFIDPENSYLSFRVATDAGTANFGSCGANALISQIILTTRNSVELERVDRVNLWSHLYIKNQKSKSWVDRYGGMMGYLDNGPASNANVSTDGTRFCIPLSVLCGFFRPSIGTLIHSYTAAGLKVQITFANYKQALYEKSPSVTNYNISDVYFQLDCVTLSENTQKTLGVQAAKTGLEYTYPRVFTNTTTLNSTTITMQCSKSIAQATRAVAVLLEQAKVQDVTADSFASTPWQITEWQYRIGNLYYPNQSVQDQNSDGVESFMLAQCAWNKTKKMSQENSLNLSDFVTNSGTMAVSLEKDTNMQLTGVPLNNSRLLELTASIKQAPSPALPYELVLFLEYTSVARSFMDNTIVAS